MNELASPSAAGLGSVPALPVIAVVIPSYKVKDFVLDVVASVPAHIQQIYVVDDACPVGSGK